MSFLSIDRDLARDSYYAATVQRGPGYPALTEAIECDVAA